jgi:hypothetical protein
MMKISLLWLALIAWAAWLLAMFVMGALSYTRVFHGGFLYMAVPLLVQAICTAGAVVGGTWRLVRGPRRWNAVAWMLLAVAPSIWMAAYVAHLIVVVSGRIIEPSLLIRAGYAMTGLVAEPIVRICHPYRYEGERFVMWSDSPDCTDEQMAAMDAHIRGLEQLLGRHSAYKVYWVRGPILSVGMRYGFGWSLGTDTKTPPDGPDGLDYLDRHEVAHFVLDQLLPNTLDLPALLHEGWAEFQSGRSGLDSRRFWAAQQNEALRSLSELTGPKWYHNHNGPVYWQGCALVDYLARRFGYAKFLDLCCTCREATFTEDVQRVLGLSLDELDAAYRRDTIEQGPPDKRSLLALKLGKGVNSDEWRRFVAAYCVGAERLRALFRHASIAATYTEESTKDAGPKQCRRERVEYHSDGTRQTRIWQFPDHHEDIVVVTPDREFCLTAQKAGQSRRLYRYATSDTNDFCGYISDMQRYLTFALDPLKFQYGTNITITGMEKKTSPSQILRVRYEAPLGKIGPWRGWWDFDTEHDYALVDASVELRGVAKLGTVSRTIGVDYQSVDGRRIPKTSRWNVVTGDSHVIHTATIESCKFAPPPRQVFELATYGKFDPQQFAATSAADPASRCVAVQVLAWIAGGCTLLGSLLAVGSARRSPAPRTAPDMGP